MIRVITATLVCAAFMAGCASKKKVEEAAPAPAAQGKKATGAATKAATKAVSDMKTSTETSCKSGSDTRVLAVKVAGSGCELHYTKFGETNSVASSQNGTEYCQSVLERIKGKLEGAGFTCQ